MWWLAMLMVSGEGLDLQGHRGARGLLPENTWPAFERALELGMTTLELDTNLTADDALIVCHDTHVNTELCRTAEGSVPEKVPIRSLSLVALQALDCGSVAHPRFPEQVTQPGVAMPSLPELLEQVKVWEGAHPEREPVRFNIELKVPHWLTPEDLATAAAAMIAAIADAGMVDRATIQCFDPRFLELVRDRKPEISRSMIFGTGNDLEHILATSARVEAQIVSPHHELVDASLVKSCHEAGYLVIPWTINEVPRMRELIALGVDGLISDYPDRLLEAVGRD